MYVCTVIIWNQKLCYLSFNTNYQDMGIFMLSGLPCFVAKKICQK